MSVETNTVVASPVINLTDEQVTAEVEAFISTVQPPRAPYYGRSEVHRSLVGAPA